jgi:polysaccharide export outer membrane protein
MGSSCFAVTTFVLMAGAAFAAQPGADYIIGPQDVLAIAVFDQPDLSSRYTVESDGSFSFPLIGRVRAGGRTLRQFEADLRQQLADGFLRNPQVAVAVEHYRSQRVFVVGEVRQPGSYALTGDMLLIEVLARAGGMTSEAAGDVVVVRAAAAGGPILPGHADGAAVIRVGVKALETGNLSGNVALKDGDTIFVPRAETIYVFGEVKSPGLYTIQRDMTVLQALALAGGATETAALNRIRIVRFVGGEKQEVKMQLNDRIQPGDTIVIPARYF